jgi:hypothetical protein
LGIVEAGLGHRRGRPPTVGLGPLVANGVSDTGAHSSPPGKPVSKLTLHPGATTFRDMRPFDSPIPGEIYHQKCTALFEHVYESYADLNESVYA